MWTCWVRRQTPPTRAVNTTKECGKNKLFSITLGLLVQAGCSRSPDGLPLSEQPGIAPPAPSNVIAMPTNHVKTQVLRPTNTIPFQLDVVKGDDPMYRFMAFELIRANSKASAALSEAEGTIGNWDITSDDIKAISSEVAKIDGFATSRHGGTAVRFDRFVIAIIGGYIGDDYFNAYLLRVPAHGWIFLETRQVPAPLTTRTP